MPSENALSLLGSTETETIQTTTDAAKVVFDAFQDGKINMGKVDDIGIDGQLEGRKWTSKPLKNGTVINLEQTKKLTPHPIKGKRHNTRYIIRVNSSDNSEEYSGQWARKMYIALTKSNKRKSVKLSEQSKQFVKNALTDLI